jgi:hypothetical protein
VSGRVVGTIKDKVRGPMRDKIKVEMGEIGFSSSLHIA